MIRQSSIPRRKQSAEPSVYTHAHLLFGGFTQRYGRAGNGMFDLFDEIYRRYAGPQSLVSYAPWYLSPADVAAELAERNETCLQATGVRLRLQLVGYSFGGQTAVNVCRQLARLADTPAVTIDRLCLCDAVARRGRLGWLHAANPCSTIQIPGNVDRLAAFVQTNPRFRLEPPWFYPAGHTLVLAAESLPLDPVVLQAEHTEIDNHLEFHDAALSGAAELHHEGEDDPFASGQILRLRRAA